MMLHMSCTHWDASRHRIEVAGILMNDGRRCGSRKNFQSLVGSRERWVMKNFSRSVVAKNWVAKNLVANG